MVQRGFGELIQYERTLAYKFKKIRESDITCVSLPVSDRGLKVARRREGWPSAIS